MSEYESRPPRRSEPALELLTPYDVVELPEALEPSLALVRELVDARSRSVALSQCTLESKVPGLLGTLAGQTQPVRWSGATLTQVWDAINHQTSWGDQATRLIAFGAEGRTVRLFETVFGTTRALNDRLYAALEEGNGLLWRSLDEVELELAMMAANLERTLGVRARVDVAILPNMEVRLPEDGHVTVLFPLSGPVRCKPAGSNEVQLQPGEGARLDDLRLCASNGPATVALVRTPPNASIRGAAEAIIPLGYRQPLLRADLPRSHSEPIISYAGSVVQDSALLVAELEQLVNQKNMARGLAHHLASLPPRFTTTLTLSLKLLGQNPLDWWIRCPLVGGFGLHSVTSGMSAMAAAGRTANMDALWAQTLARLSDGVTMPLVELQANLSGADRSSVEACIRWSIATGWLELVGEP